MGQQSSKTSIEARVVFHRVGAVDACCSAASVVRIQKKVSSQSAWPLPSPRAPEKSAVHARTQSRCATGGLVYVMDNPTGGVWVKPGDKWTRS